MQKPPELPQSLTGCLENLCRTFPPDCIPDLRVGVATALERLAHQKDAYLGPNINLAQDLARRIYYLIDNYRSFPPEQHPLIVGAVRYFMIEDDQVPDHKPITGLDDDARVINYVLGQLGVLDLLIDLP